MFEIRALYLETRNHAEAPNKRVKSTTASGYFQDRRRIHSFTISHLPPMLPGIFRLPELLARPELLLRPVPWVEPA